MMLYGDSERASEFELHRELSKIGKPVDKTDWQMSQPTVNAYYDPQENNINFPAGILQPPFWDNKLDDAVNYGGIGAVIGHELTHGFDDQGRQYDAAGNLRDWWTPTDAKAFDEREDCLEKEYSSFTAVDSVHVNGKLTLGENTADNGGVRLRVHGAEKALGGKHPAKRDGYTAEQRFFLGWGQIWCENRTDEVARLLRRWTRTRPAKIESTASCRICPNFRRRSAARWGSQWSVIPLAASGKRPRVISRNVRISTVGLRGVVGKGLSAEKILDFASAFAAFLPEDRSSIVIGRDPRASGVMVREGVLAALSASGRDVIDLGIVSTPIVQHAIRRLSAAGGVSIGASHSGAEWNALKFFGALGTYLSTAEASELLDIYHLRHFKFPSFDQIGKIREDPDAMDPYLSDLAAVYDFDKLRRFRVLVDCSNGTSAPILRRTERSLRVQLYVDERARRRFCARPEYECRNGGPSVSAADCAFTGGRRLLIRLRLRSCGDGDRARPARFRRDELPLLADYLLPRSSAKLIITNFSTTALVEEVAARHGGRVLRVPVGRQAAMDALALHKPEEIAAAGEGTGAVMMPDFRFVYDGIASMLGVLALIRAARRTAVPNPRGIFTLLDSQGIGSAEARTRSRAASRSREGICGRIREFSRWPARRLAGPMVSCARQPDRADRARDRGAERRSAGRAVRISHGTGSTICVSTSSRLACRAFAEWSGRSSRRSSPARSPRRSGPTSAAAES